MSKKRVDIPVKVTGSEEAKAALRGVATDVEDVGAAGSQQARGTQQAAAAAVEGQRALRGYGAQARQAAQAQGELNKRALEGVKRHLMLGGSLDAISPNTLKAAEAAKKGAKATAEYSDAAKTAAVGIIGQFSPALAALVNIASDVAKGFKGITASLVGIVTVGALIGGISYLFQRAADKAREFKEALEKVRVAQQKLADEQRKPYEQISESLRKVGGYSRVNTATAYRDQFLGAMAAGVPQDAAAQLAGVGFAAGLSADDLALLYSAGIEPQTPAEAREALARIRRDPKALADVARQARELRFSPAGLTAAAESNDLRRRMETDPRFAEVVGAQSQDALVLERMKQLGMVDPNASIDVVDQARRELAEAQKTLDEIMPILRGEKIGWGNASYYYNARKRAEETIKKYGMLDDVVRSYREVGIYDTTGDVRDFDAVIGGRTPMAGPRMFSPDTMRALGETNNYIGQQVIIDQFGVNQRPMTPVLDIEGGY